MPGLHSIEAYCLVRAPMSGSHGSPPAGWHITLSGLPCLVCTVYHLPVLEGGETCSQVRTGMSGHSAYFLPVLEGGEAIYVARSGLPRLAHTAGACQCWLGTGNVA